MKITSSAFENNHPIPAKYTCDGENINPPLEFQDITKLAKSLVLIMDDPDAPDAPDAPGGTFTHWVIYNIPPYSPGVKEGENPDGHFGLTSSGNLSYVGACPPKGEHKYFFKLFALDNNLEFKDHERVTRKMIEEKMQGHIVDKAELMGLYARH